MNITNQDDISKPKHQHETINFSKPFDQYLESYVPQRIPKIFKSEVNPNISASLSKNLEKFILKTVGNLAPKKKEGRSRVLPKSSIIMLYIAATGSGGSASQAVALGSDCSGRPAIMSPRTYNKAIARLGSKPFESIFYDSAWSEVNNYRKKNCQDPLAHLFTVDATTVVLNGTQDLSILGFKRSSTQDGRHGRMTGRCVKIIHIATGTIIGFKIVPHLGPKTGECEIFLELLEDKLKDFDFSGACIIGDAIYATFPVMSHLYQAKIDFIFDNSIRTNDYRILHNDSFDGEKWDDYEKYGDFKPKLKPNRMTEEQWEVAEPVKIKILRVNYTRGEENIEVDLITSRKNITKGEASACYEFRWDHEQQLKDMKDTCTIDLGKVPSKTYIGVEQYFYAAFIFNNDTNWEKRYAGEASAAALIRDSGLQEEEELDFQPAKIETTKPEAKTQVSKIKKAKKPKNKRNSAYQQSQKIAIKNGILAEKRKEFMLRQSHRLLPIKNLQSRRTAELKIESLRWDSSIGVEKIRSRRLLLISQAVIHKKYYRSNPRDFAQRVAKVEKIKS